MRSPVETRCAGVADMVSREIIPKGVKGARGEEQFKTEGTEKSKAERTAETQSTQRKREGRPLGRARIKQRRGPPFAKSLRTGRMTARSRGT